MGYNMEKIEQAIISVLAENDNKAVEKEILVLLAMVKLNAISPSWHNISLRAEVAQYLQSSRFAIREICGQVYVRRAA
jgi:hypothetical protein